MEATGKPWNANEATRELATKARPGAAARDVLETVFNPAAPADRHSVLTVLSSTTQTATRYFTQFDGVARPGTDSTAGGDAVNRGKINVACQADVEASVMS